MDMGRPGNRAGDSRARGASICRVRPALRVALVLVLASVPAALVIHALDLGGLAQWGMIVLVMFIASLADREGFYGPRAPRSR